MASSTTYSMISLEVQSSPRYTLVNRIASFVVLNTIVTLSYIVGLNVILNGVTLASSNTFGNSSTTVIFNEIVADGLIHGLSCVHTIGVNWR